MVTLLAVAGHAYASRDFVRPAVAAFWHGVVVPLADAAAARLKRRCPRARRLARAPLSQGHDAAVLSVRLLLRGSLLVTASADGRVLLWDFIVSVLAVRGAGGGECRMVATAVGWHGAVCPRGECARGWCGWPGRGRWRYGRRGGWRPVERTGHERGGPGRVCARMRAGLPRATRRRRGGGRGACPRLRCPGHLRRWPRLCWRRIRWAREWHTRWVHCDAVDGVCGLRGVGGVC